MQDNTVNTLNAIQSYLKNILLQYGEAAEQILRYFEIRTASQEITDLGSTYSTDVLCISKRPSLLMSGDQVITSSVGPSGFCRGAGSLPDKIISYVL